MRIAHVSDIHIRGLQRHGEYRVAFEAFFDRCRQLQVEAIFVGGDIWHTKTQGITPEAVSLITRFFKGSADIAPVYVTLGNHDGILSNSTRLDAISPILSAIGGSSTHPIVLCKKSGIYPMHDSGFNLCVFSCFDEEGWSSVKPEAGKTNIAAFHGGIAGCLLDSDMEYEADTTLDMFTGFDVALLGDIHRMQFLAHKTVQMHVDPSDLHRYPGAQVVGEHDGALIISTQMPWVGYSGSLLQQNFGEALPKGFLLWDIGGPSSHSVWFEEIETPDPYVTVKWMGDVPATLATIQSKKGCRVRLVCDDTCTAQDERQLQTELRLSHDIREFVTKREKQNKALLVSDVISEDLHSPATHIKLIKEMVGNHHTQDEWEAAEAVVCKALGEAGSRSDDARGVTWSVQNLEFDNLFTYAGDNSINFTEMKGVTGIFGPNRIGKSSIIGAMVYCMFNTTDRGAMKNIHLIRTGQQSCRAKMDIVVADRKLQIERTSSLKHEKNGRVWAPTALTLIDSDDNASGEQRSDTEKTIRRTIGTVDDFFMTALSAQGTMNRFIDEGATSRKTYLGRFLDLDIFDRVLETIKPDASAIKSRMKALPDRDWTLLTSEAERKMRKIQDEIDEIDKRVSDLHKKRSDAQERLLATANASVVTDADLARLSAAVEKRKTALQTEKDRLASIVARIDAAEKKAAAIDALKSATDIDSLKAQLKTQRELEKKISDLTASLRVEKISLSSAYDDANVLKEIPCGDTYPTCKFIKRSFESRDKVESLRAAVSSAESALKSSKDALALVASLDTETKITSYTTAVAKESEIRSAIKNGAEEKRAAEETCKRAQEDLSTAARDHEDAVQRSQDTSSRETQAIKNELDQINQQIDQLGLERGEKQSESAKCEAEIEGLKKGQEEFKSLKRQWRVYETLVSAYSKKGLPSQILDKLLPAINAELSEILSGVVSFQVQLEIDPETNSLEIYIDYGDTRRIIELGSGMEKMIASLAIRVALTRITSLPKPDFIVIDEGFGTLDETQLASCIELIKSLKRIYRFILVISHVDAVKDAVDQVIEISRVGSTSRVVA
jgi:hypothetical protein